MASELTSKLQDDTPSVTVAEQLKAELELLTPQLIDSLPSVGITPERMVQLSLTEIRRNPKLIECRPKSILSGVMRAAQDGLNFGSDECYLVPRWNRKKRCYEASYQRGYRGRVTLHFRTGLFKDINCGPVYENDNFVYKEGLHPVCELTPNLRHPGELILFYACATTVTGGCFVTRPMTLSEINEIREMSATRNREGQVVGPWITNYNEMAKKTVFNRLSKLMPLSTELREQLMEEDREEFSATPEINLGEATVVDEQETATEG